MVVDLRKRGSVLIALKSGLRESGSGEAETLGRRGRRGGKIAGAGTPFESPTKNGAIKGV